MKRNLLLIGSIAVLVVAAVFMVKSANQQPPLTPATNSTPVQPASDHQHPTQQRQAQAVPAHFESAPTKSSLGPTLDPAQFTGITRDAYRAAREIPVTLTQLPCYCHCDRGFGHKSLYSCFEDDHASHCDVCVREAVLALKLEKEQKMTPAQIRDAIVAQYSH